MYLLVPLNIAEYIKVRRNKIYFGNYFRKDRAPFYRIALSTTPDGDSKNIYLEDVRSIHPTEIDDSWLPCGTVSDQELIFTPLGDFNSLPAPVVWTWELLERNERHFRIPPEVVAGRSRRPVADLRFVKPGSSEEHVMPVKFLGKMLQSIQSFLESVAQSISGDTTVRGQISSALKSSVQLDAVAVYPSSFGIRLEAHEGSFLDDSITVKVFDRLNCLLSKTDDKQNLKSMLLDLGPRASAHYKAIAKHLAGAGVSVTIRSAVPGEMTSRESQVSAQDAVNIVEWMEKEYVSQHSLISVTGQLVGLSLKTKYFRLESADHVYSGKISDQCVADQNSEITVGPFYNAQLSVQIEIRESTGQEEEKFELLNLARVK